MRRAVFTTMVLLLAPLVAAGDISGYWKHAQEPGWIEIRLEQGTGTVLRNDKFPERVGREILKDLQAGDAGSDVWTGRIYAEKLGEYKDAEITLPEPDLMKISVKVGFMRRTIEWQRVDEVPEAPAEP